MMMKLFHRTSFWGKSLNGYKARGHNLPIIQVQAIMDEDCSGGLYGCCPHHGKRCVMVDESHFIATSREDWNLYHVKTVLGSESTVGDFFHDFALIPRSKATWVNLGMGWTLLGTVRPCAARMDLAPLLRPFIRNNNSSEHTYANHHIHIALAMDFVIVDNGRHERQQQRNNAKQQQAKQQPRSQVDVDDQWQHPGPGMPFYERANSNTTAVKQNRLKK